MVQGLLKGAAAGLAASAGIVVLTSQVLGPVEIAEPAAGTGSSVEMRTGAGDREVRDSETAQSVDADSADGTETAPMAAGGSGTVEDERTDPVATDMTDIPAPSDGPGERGEPRDAAAVSDTFEIESTEQGSVDDGTGTDDPVEVEGSSEGESAVVATTGDDIEADGPAADEPAVETAQRTPGGDGTGEDAAADPASSDADGANVAATDVDTDGETASAVGPDAVQSAPSVATEAPGLVSPPTDDAGIAVDASELPDVPSGTPNLNAGAEPSVAEAPTSSPSPSPEAPADAPGSFAAPDSESGPDLEIAALDREPDLRQPNDVPVAQAADVAPALGDTAAGADPAPVPDLTAPADVGADVDAGQPSSDESILPVPESRVPSPPLADTPPDTLEAFAAQELVGPDNADLAPAPMAQSDDGLFDRQDTGEGALSEDDLTGTTDDTTADPTGRDRVRVNRLAQITPPAPEETEETEETDQETGEDAFDPDADALLPPEMQTEPPAEDLGDPSSEGTDAASEDAAPQSDRSRPSSNLIERRLQAAEADTSVGEDDISGDSTIEESDALSRDTLAALSDATVPDSPATEDMPEDPKVATPQAALTGVAMDDFARPFDNPAGLPLVSVVLLDFGGPPIDLPLTISVALDAGQPDVAARADIYRDRGYEVLVIPQLPRGGTAQDIEQALQASLQMVDGAVAVIPDPASDVQSDRAATETLIGRLAETGHGLVSFASGLNRAQQFAGRAGVPAGLVFREIDAQGQDLRAVKRFVDQAAFRAQQERAVILVGRNRPETRGALMEWRLSNRAESVTMAPVSAAIRALSP